MPRIPTENQIINISADYKQWFEVLQQKLVAAQEEDNPTDNIWLIASDSSLNGIIGLVNCLRFEPGGHRLRYIFNYDSTGSRPDIDFTVSPFSDILVKNLIANVINEGKVGTFRHLRLADTYDKTLSNEYYLNLGQTRVRDIMLVEGRLPIDSSLTDCPIGVEFAGRRSDTGERVMGMDARNRCLSTTIYATELYMTAVPEHWSMDDAVSILNAYMTLYYGLIEKAQLQQGESVLIHSGAGSVGQAALNICQHFGCDIYVTVGTEDKVTFLKNECNIPENRIFNSRDIRFKNEILKMTDGKGVHIVVNSLSGEGLDATYECVRDHGRIVEIGKSDLYDNKSLGMYCFTRGVQLTAVVLDLLIVTDIQFMCRFYKWVQGNCTNGCIKPIKATVLKPEEAVKAFHSMTTGEHIGRLIIKFRDEETVRTPLLAMNRTMNMRTTVKTFFDPNKVYVITEGLGTFGLELIQWMHYRGGRKFVVTSRYGITTDYQKFIINRFKEVSKSDKNLSLDLLVSTANGMTIEGTQQLLNEAKNLGPIGGVFHLALALYNELFEQQFLEDFCAAVDIKHKIFAHLDQLSRQLAYKLDYFVVFSSVSCGKGNGGQSNYGFGNSMCERICDERRRDGLHGLAVQYGPIGDVGVMGGVDQGLGFTSMRKQRIHSCCDVLDKLLAMNTPIVTSYIRVNNQTKEGTLEQNFIESIWRDMNIDPNVTPNDTTLADIGMESMFAVVLQQKLEKEYKMSLTVNLIKCLTVGLLKESENAKTGLVQSYLNSLRQSTDFLLKYNFHISKEKTIALNKCQTGKRLYILPPFELNFTAWEEWALRANRPVIGLNWTPDVSRLTSLQEVTKYYVNLLKHLEPMDGKYDVIGHLDGAVICTQLVVKGMADIAVAIDAINYKHFYVDNKLNDDFMSKFVIKSLLKQIPDSYVNKILKEISDIKTKIAIIGKELVGLGGRGLVATDLTHVLEIMFARIECLLEYRLNATTMHSNDMKTQLVVIKPIEHNPTDDSEAEHHHQDQLADNYIVSAIMGNMSNDANLRVERIICENPMDVTNGAIAEKITELLID
ncbi:unnamed protein product [Oppiella nova]|uniref:Carrier domain-containing protein n=1 Tax=Oppiella nova TaxID=334625 RepID=A0A7R9LTZ1_9ACAR|nr:unnamed protein product [Oppiella nova]CAG2166966.1 unnamed protein product [Oppiella nova]